MFNFKKWGAGLAAVVLTTSAQAALIARGGGMIYDTTRNITWLADMNYAFTSGYAAANAGGIYPNLILGDGSMSWDAATAWADNLVYGGFSDWRLPTLNPADTSCSLNFDPGDGFPNQHYGFGCSGGELSGLFVADQADLALFSNVQPFGYWSGTEYAPNPRNVWVFDNMNNFQDISNKHAAFYAVAVRPGDVMAASVPEPQTLVLALMAIGAILWTRRKRERGSFGSVTCYSLRSD